MDQGYWIILKLDKGRLGEHVATLGGLLLTKLKNALFGRRSRRLFTLYCDEIQNLVSFGGNLETLFSEARKFAVSVVSANQFLEQYPAEMRAAVLSVGSHAFFQLSGTDADRISSLLGGGKGLAELLRNLPPPAAGVQERARALPAGAGPDAGSTGRAIPGTFITAAASAGPGAGPKWKRKSEPDSSRPGQ